ncbi:TPA: YSIRK-type signal peptide-containing protein [Streptococcus suis]
MFRKQRFSIRKFSVGAASVCVGLFLGGQIVNADSLPTENPATVAVSNKDVQAEVAAPVVTENQELAISAEVSVETETEPVIEVSAPVEIPIEQYLRLRKYQENQILSQFFITINIIPCLPCQVLSMQQLSSH